MTDEPSRRRQGLGRAALRRAAETVVRVLITTSGLTAIAVLAAITVFLVLNAQQAISTVGLLTMITGKLWYPTSTPPLFGFLPYIVASLRATFVALVVAVPLGVAAAVYISEFAGRRTKELAKPIIEFMAAVPSVVYGLLAVAVAGPLVKVIFNLTSGLTILTAGLLLGLMAVPTIVSISEDALHAVPDELRQGSLALGNTRWQTVYKVIVPSASSGIFASVMLGLGRAIGETMVVLMAAGNTMTLTWSLIASGRPMTSVMAGEMGETVQGGLHYSALFVIGLTLFIITFVINLAADTVLERQRSRWRR
jgi:phosphate transport system permease protein